jgi:hypothetical protein
MSQVFIRPNEAATLVGTESTFATTPTMTRATPIAGSVELDPTQAEIANEDQRVHLYDRLSPVLGMKDASAKLGYYARPDSVQSTAAASPAANALDVLLASAWGGVGVAAGSTVQASSTASSVILDAGHGSRFPVGSIALVEVGGTLEPAYVSGVATDTLTPWPSLSAAPNTSSGLAVNTHLHFPEPASTGTITLQHALAGDANHQWTLNGCHSDFELKVDRNGLIRFDFALKAATWTGPSDQSITTAAGNDGLGAPFAVKDAVCYFQPAATVTRTAVKVRSISAKFTAGKEFLPELGGTEGKGGVMRVGSREFAEVTLRMLGSDVTYDGVNSAPGAAAWTGRTAMRLLFAVPQGSGLTRRWFVFCLPKCVIVGKPKTLVDGGAVVTDVTVQAQIDSSLSTDRARAPAVIGIG